MRLPGGRSETRPSRISACATGRERSLPILPAFRRGRGPRRIGTAAVPALSPPLEPNMLELLRLAKGPVWGRRRRTRRPDFGRSDPLGFRAVLQALQKVGACRPADCAVFEAEPSIRSVHLAGRDEIRCRPFPAPLRSLARPGAARPGRRKNVRGRTVRWLDMSAAFVHPLVGRGGDGDWPLAMIGVRAAGQPSRPGLKAVAERAVGAADQFR